MSTLRAPGCADREGARAVLAIRRLGSAREVADGAGANAATWGSARNVADGADADAAAWGSARNVEDGADADAAAWGSARNVEDVVVGAVGAGN